MGGAEGKVAYIGRLLAVAPVDSLRLCISLFIDTEGTFRPER